VEWLIVDEADKLFEEGTRGFREQLDEITRACTNENLRRGMFSATSTSVVTKWCRRNMKRLVTITVGQRSVIYFIILIIIILIDRSIKKNENY
jgi:ATP-dependent RNA helicase DDX52/ROK1